MCDCDCKRDVWIWDCVLKSSKEHIACRQPGCGYSTSITHGKCDTPEYRAWLAMKRVWEKVSRANPARKFKLHPAWHYSFLQFLEDMGPKPGPKYIFERISLEGDFVPDNCRWATRAERHKDNPMAAYKTPEYAAWVQVKRCCVYRNNPNYARFGALGVKMHPAWIDSFAQFLKDMGEMPHSHGKLERISLDGDFEPSNCRWTC